MMLHVRGTSALNERQIQEIPTDTSQAAQGKGSGTAFSKAISGSAYFYTNDLIGSIRELIDGSGNVSAVYGYGPYGELTLLEGTLLPDFCYAAYYYHAPSGLSLTLHRAFSSQIGRWLSRDPIGEDGGLNLYAYARNRPTSTIDPSGLDERNIPLNTFAENLGIPVSALKGGCFDVVNAALGRTPGTRPDVDPNTKCWVGATAQQTAENYWK